jgi:hypothetical protein
MSRRDAAGVRVCLFACVHWFVAAVAVRPLCLHGLCCARHSPHILTKLCAHTGDMPRQGMATCSPVQDSLAANAPSGVLLATLRTPTAAAAPAPSRAARTRSRSATRRPAGAAGQLSWSNMHALALTRAATPRASVSTSTVRLVYSSPCAGMTRGHAASALQGDACTCDPCLFALCRASKASSNACSFALSSSSTCAPARCQRWLRGGAAHSARAAAATRLAAHSTALRRHDAGIGSACQRMARVSTQRGGARRRCATQQRTQNFL